MSTFKFSGKIDTGRRTTAFEREVEANSLKHAEEKIYSQLGSEHSVDRSKIEIDESEEA